MMAWVHWLCKSSPNILDLSEGYELWDFVHSGAWDDGALRTLDAYFFCDPEEAQGALYRYYSKFYKDGAWTCRNPSAALVWVVRDEAWHM